MGSRRGTSPDPYWGEFDPPWSNPDQDMLRRVRRPLSSTPRWEERLRAWTEEPDLYRPRESQHRRQQRSPEPYHPIRSQPLQFDFDRYGPSGYSERRHRQLSPSRAATTNDDDYGRPRYYRGDREMDRDMEREIEREREGEMTRARRKHEASRGRRRREEECERERGRRDRNSGGGGTGSGGGGGGNGGWTRRLMRP